MEQEMRKVLARAAKTLFASLAFIAATATSCASAGEVLINFDALYTLNNFYSPTSLSSPIRTKLSLSFSLRGSYTTYTRSDGSKRLMLAAGIGAIQGDSEVFSILPAPHISWGPDSQGNVYIERRADGTYRLYGSIGYSYAICTSTCTQYVKDFAVLSSPISIDGYDPFLQPERFIIELGSRNVTFESNLTQYSWYRVNGIEHDEGAHLGTSLYSIGQGSNFLGGGVWISSIVQVPEPSAQTSVVSAVLPASRAVQLRTPATAFATIINSGSVTATGCQIALPAGFAADFYYQATDPATNAPIPGYKNVPVDIGAGQPKSFLIALTPQAVFAAQDVRLRFNCANAPDAAVYSGLNTLLLSSSATPGPDVVALAATVNGDGIVNVPGPTGTGFFAVASVNVGSSATITASANTGGSALPLALSICQTNPATGSCLAPPSAAVTTTIDAGATPTFAIFAKGSGFIPFDPANNRVSVVFRDGGGQVRGATSVAIRTQ